MNNDGVLITIAVFLVGLVIALVFIVLTERHIRKSCDLQGSFISRGEVYDCVLREAE